MFQGLKLRVWGFACARFMCQALAEMSKLWGVISSVLCISEA